MRKGNVLCAFRNAFRGIIYCARHERNMKIHLGAMVLVAFLAWWSKITKYELLILVITVASVLVAEMVNTAVETIVDMISPEFHPMAKIAKDVAAGAVLITAIVSLLVGYMLFFYRIWT
ncbi:diacylglycerol kinase family protein [Pelosinus sp. UFO1]|uniref:diacylglycerol kinase family protein n=1 Tax=Pelosinus sp. UFO1 TaxID=484770 RepID=UPI00056F1278|nr:diacylglycerol kinase family protein [Pelosinus sp. UFO1]